jgi:hypothetical protein
LTHFESLLLQEKENGIRRVKIARSDKTKGMKERESKEQG